VRGRQRQSKRDPLLHALLADEVISGAPTAAGLFFESFAIEYDQRWKARLPCFLFIGNGAVVNFTPGKVAIVGNIQLPSKANAGPFSLPNASPHQARAGLRRLRPQGRDLSKPDVVVRRDPERSGGCALELAVASGLVDEGHQPCPVSAEDRSALPPGNGDLRCDASQLRPRLRDRVVPQQPECLTSIPSEDQSFGNP